MIELRNLSKSFVTTDGSVEALRGVSLTIHDGDIYGIIGMSGAGKSTLVRCINMLEKPTEGSVLLDGTDLGSLNEKEIREMRRNVTMIFQSFNLLMQSTCLQNVLFPLKLAKVPREEAVRRARDLLKTVGLPDKENAYPAQLSGGQQQRVAIARALATNPRVLLCDEATSALDPKTTHSILELIRRINRETGITVIVITHQMSVVQEGEVSEIFSRPRTAAARALVFPETAEEVSELVEGSQILRIIFNGASAAREPLIAKMAVECGIMAGIIGASTRSIGDRAYGYMLLEIPGTPEDLARAVTYLSGIPDIVTQVEAEYGKEDKE